MTAPKNADAPIASAGFCVLLTRRERVALKRHRQLSVSLPGIFLMGIIIRQGVKYSTVAYVGVVIGAFNTLWLFPKFLSPDEIGVLRLVQENGLFLAGFIQLGAANIADRFYPQFKTTDRTHNGFLPFLLLYASVGFAVFSVAYLAFPDFWRGIYQKNAPAINQYYYYLLPLVLFCMYQLILEAYSRINLRIVVPAIFREVILKLGTLLLVTAFFTRVITFQQLVIYVIGFYGVILLLLLAYLANLGVLHWRINRERLSQPLMRQMVVYGAFIVLGGGATLIVSKIDFLMLGALAGTREVAIYTIAFFIGTVIEIPRRAISQISTPLISQAWSENRLDKIEEMYVKSSINQLVIGAFLFLGIWCNVDAIFNLVPNSEIYRPGKYVILFIGMARLFDMATGVNGEIILQSRYYRFNLLLVTLLAVLLVVTNLIFIPTYGITGAAFATALSVFLFNIIKFLFLWIKFRIQPFTIRTLVVLLIAAITFFAASLVPPPPDQLVRTLLNITLRSLVIISLFGGFVLLFRVSEEANQLLQTSYDKLRAAISGGNFKVKR